jgi:ATP/maltotriose-dependent transcriptional regulator MalT
MNLLERDAFLQELNARLRRASDGQGQLVFLGGEAGIGKSALIEAFLEEARPHARTMTVSCDGSAVPGPLGPLSDIAEALGPDVERLLADEAPRDLIFRAVLRAFRSATGPTVIVGEDAHWVDEATLELIRFLGRRIDRTHVLYIIVYRNDELGPYHPLRRVLGDLANAPSVRRIDLGPLSPDAVAMLATGTDVDPDELYERTGGNPFFVTETLAGGTKEIPATVRDAVLARAANLSLEGRAVLDAAAVLETPVDPRLLAAVIGAPIDEIVEECLAVGMLRTADTGLTFRHAISRDTILSTMSIPRRRALHQRVLQTMLGDATLSMRVAQLAYHAEQADDLDMTIRYATVAARQATAFGAHCEAAAQYGRALRFAQELPVTERLDLLQAQAFECYLTGDLGQAIALQHDVVGLCQEIGDTLRQGDNTRALSRFYWFSGQVEQANRFAEEALALLIDLPAGPELAMAWSNVSQLAMLGRDLPRAIFWGEKAIRLATELNDSRILAHAMTNVGTARYGQGDDAGRLMLEQAVHLARQTGLEDDAARAMTNLGYNAWSHHQLDIADTYLSEGISFAAGRDLVAMELYQRAVRASVRLARGDWARARQESESIANLPAAVAATRIVALTCLGRIRTLLREDAGDALAEALTLAAETGELQRLGPVTSARAEVAWLNGDLHQVIDDVARTYELAIDRDDSWITGELALWMYRAGIAVDVQGLPKPFALEIAGRAREASDAWSALGFPLESARAMASSGTEDALRDALMAFEAVGARADAARVSRLLREMGARQVPRGPRPATRANAEHLTTRELDVLALLAEGASNREIADNLYLSPKTVGHHVSSILAKLGVASRRHAARHAQAHGLLQHREPPTEK